jgi:hypothetical protein
MNIDYVAIDVEPDAYEYLTTLWIERIKVSFDQPTLDS